MPEPTTITSAEVVQPGAGATSRPGTVSVTGRRRLRARMQALTPAMRPEPVRA